MDIECTLVRAAVVAVLFGLLVAFEMVSAAIVSIPDSVASVIVVTIVCTTVGLIVNWFLEI